MLQKTLHGGARARSRLAQDERLALQRPRLQGFALRQRVLDRGDKYVRMCGKRLGAGGEFRGRPAHDGNVDFVGLQHLDQLLAVAHHQFDVDALVLLVKLRQQVGQKIFGGTDHADREQADLQLLQPGGGVFGILQRG